MTFAFPAALVALVAIPLLLGLYLYYERTRTQYARRWGTPALLPNLVDRAPGRLRHVPLAILLVALAALVVGVARPHATVSEPREEATVLLAIDVSRSMGARDVSPTRLGAAQLAAWDIVKRVPTKYRLGLVAFGSSAQVAVAPTNDRDLVKQAIQELRPGEGTAIGDAVMRAATLGTRLRASDGSVPPTSVLLISDGARDGGNTAPRAAAQRARTLHVPVYTALVGTRNGIVDHKLPGGYIEQIRVPADPSTLQLIARTTGARYFDTLDRAQLSAVYTSLHSRLGHKKQSREITDVFAGGSALLLLAGGALSALWFRRVP